MAWQTCPKCFGQGKIWQAPDQPWSETYTSDGKYFDCDVCKGEKIIDIETGRPPSEKISRMEMVKVFQKYIFADGDIWIIHDLPAMYEELFRSIGLQADE